MNLEEMKAGWQVLNERLQQNEILNKRIIKEMIETRITSAHQKLQWKALGGYVIYFLGLLIMIFNQVYFHTPLWKTLTVSMLLVVGLLLGIPLTINLFRLKVEDPVQISYKRILHYRKRMKVSYAIMMISGLLAFGIIMVNEDLKNPIFLFIYCGSFFIAILGSLIEYRWDSSKVEAIRKGLEELKEFEEESGHNQN